MKTRMQPIGGLLKRYNRIVRDISNELGKKINLNLVGCETELDRSLIELIKDPLTHIIRNSCDHGIENSEEREKSGKSCEGQIEIKAFHEGGQVIIKITDDGKGLDHNQLRSRAVDKGILTKDQAQKLSVEDAHQLIFYPGFSTAAQVTNLSGRGVGMDVVKSNLEALGGGVKLTSTIGKGIVFHLNIPLTLAIVPALTINCMKSRYVIPQIKLIELVRVEKNEEKYTIELVNNTPVLTLRGELLPLVNLCEVQGRESKQDFINRYYENKTINIVVLNSEQGKYGLVVDGVEETGDIVVKPLNKALGNILGYSGVTVLGNGDVALILDIEELAQFVSIKSDVVETDKALYENNTDSEEYMDLLQFDLGVSSKLSVPLSYVDRLEEISNKSIEISGDDYIVNYRNSILRVIDLRKDIAGEGILNLEGSEQEDYQVIVIQNEEHRVGLLVNQILDVHPARGAQIQDVLNDDRFAKRANLSHGILTIINVERYLNNTDSKDKYELKVA